MSAFPPLSGNEQTSGERGKMTASDERGNWKLLGTFSSRKARLLIQINCQGGGEYPAFCFHAEWEDDMPESVYDVILLIGTSKESWEKAAANAIEQASKSLRNLRVAEIVELDMQLDAKGKVEAYRAKVRLSFKVER
jgi:flavin-binding protein dodecin